MSEEKVDRNIDVKFIIAESKDEFDAIDNFKRITGFGVWDRSKIDSTIPHTEKLAVADGKFIGFFAYHIGVKDPGAYLNFIYIVPEYRNKGVATKMIAHFLEATKDQKDFFIYAPCTIIISTIMKHYPNIFHIIIFTKNDRAVGTQRTIPDNKEDFAKIVYCFKQNLMALNEL